MATQTASDPAREYRLIEQLELRIASADSDEKFEGIIQKFLPALILKLESETERNRNLAIKVCQYVSQRLKISQSIQLPVQGLLKNLREAQNAFVRRFSLLFLQQGLTRIRAAEVPNMLPAVLQTLVPPTADSDPLSQKMWTISFDFLLDAMKEWRAPERGGPEEQQIKETFGLSSGQSDILAVWIGAFLVYDPKELRPSSQPDGDIWPVLEKHFKQRTRVVPQLAKFLFTPIFDDTQRLVPATILSVDPNPAAAMVGDTIFKQCTFDLEADASIDALFQLYPTAKPKLKTRILSLLSRSQKSTNRSTAIFELVQKQLNSPDQNLEGSKLRSALFNYLTWTVRMSESFQDISGQVQQVLKEYIELQGWPNMRDRSLGEAELRAKAYESIGLLSSKKTTSTASSTSSNLDLISWLFTSLRCDTTRDIRGSIEEAISRIMIIKPAHDEEYTHKLRELLLWNVSAKPGDEDPVYYYPSVNSTSYPAVRFANKCLRFKDPVARLIDVIATGAMNRREIAEEGVRGLDPYWHQSNRKLLETHGSENDVDRPGFQDLMTTFFSNESIETYLAQKPVLASAVTFCRNILICEGLHGTPDAIWEDADWKTRIHGLVRNNQDVRSRLKSHYRQIDPAPLIQLIERALMGLSLGSDECAEIAIELLSLIDDERLSKLRHAVFAGCSQMLSDNAMQTKAARCLGILESNAETWERSADTELHEFSHWETAIGTEAVKVRGHVLCATSILTRAGLRGRFEGINEATRTLRVQLEAMIMRSSDLSIRNTALNCFGQLALCVKPFETFKLGSLQMMDKLFAESKKENERAVSALGRVINYNAASIAESEIETLVDRIFTLHEVKRAEFHFALGEALSVAVAGFKSTSTITELDVDATAPEWGYHEALMDQILDKAIEACKTTKPTLKKAAAIWLLSIIQFCGDLPPIQPRLRDCQAAFGRLLNDRDEVVQETGSRGLGIVYEKGDKGLRDDLVHDLVQSFTGSNAKMSGTVNEDTELFEAGALPTEAGQSVTTYKDIVSLATEMGDPSLVYKFMNLASNNAIWSSRAAFGRFGLGNVLADSSYLSENKKFYPKLFRYRFDPNPNVQRSMNEIWKALVKDSNAVIDQHFDLIMDDLLKSVVSGREWRAREGSCAAITDLVQGRDVDKFEKYLDDIWKVAFKVLDDVKESVRQAAMKLCRNLTSMLIRNLEVGQGSTKRVTTMLNHAMPFLLQQMDGGAGKDVQQYATVTLLEVVKKSPPRSLQLFAPAVLETLIVSLSSLEHESINYLHLNADKYGLTTEKLDNMRVSSVNASPVTEAIDSCLESLTVSPSAESNTGEAMQGVESSSSPPMQDAMKRLEGVFKSAIGLPSKVGLSRVIVTLVVRYHVAFKPFADRFAQITRKHLLDRNATISVASGTSLGYIMRLVSEKEIQATSRYAQKLYFDSQELSHRSVAGEILQAISKTSNDVFMNF
jgi:proteasome component ECM29